MALGMIDLSNKKFLLFDVLTNKDEAINNPILQNLHKFL